MKATKIKNTIKSLNEALKNGGDWRQFNVIIKNSELQYHVSDIEGA